MTQPAAVGQNEQNNLFLKGLYGVTLLSLFNFIIYWKIINTLQSADRKMHSHVSGGMLRILVDRLLYFLKYLYDVNLLPSACTASIFTR